MQVQSYVVNDYYDMMLMCIHVITMHAMSNIILASNHVSLELLPPSSSTKADNHVSSELLPPSSSATVANHVSSELLPPFLERFLPPIPHIASECLPPYSHSVDSVVSPKPQSFNPFVQLTMPPPPPVRRQDDLLSDDFEWNDSDSDFLTTTTYYSEAEADGR